MTPIDVDVFVCCREQDQSDLAQTIAEGLSRLGFRVYASARMPGVARDDARLNAIEQAPDFVVMLTAGAAGGWADERDPMRLEIAHALRLGRIVVPVCLPGVRVPVADQLPPDLADLAGCARVVYDPARPGQSLALVAHSLSSDADLEDRKLMRWATWGGVLVAAILLAVVLRFTIPPVLRAVTTTKAPPALAPFAVSWSAVALRGAGSAPAVIDLVDGTAVMPGDRIKLLFRPSAAGFAYVLARTGDGTVSVLFPPAAMRGASAVLAERTYEAPAAAEWFGVGDGPGAMEVDIIAGYDSLENLEELAEDPGGELPHADRLELLISTLNGLLDGRHGLARGPLKTRSGRVIDRRLSPVPGPGKTVIATEAGAVVERVMRVEPGLISASVLLRLSQGPR
jgi:hypothetical protein